MGRLEELKKTNLSVIQNAKVTAPFKKAFELARKYEKEVIPSTGLFPTKEQIANRMLYHFINKSSELNLADSTLVIASILANTGVDVRGSAGMLMLERKIRDGVDAE